MNRVQEKALWAWGKAWKEENLDAETRRLIAQADEDLYCGPCQEEDFPGFETACKRIKAALADLPGTIYIDEDGEITGRVDEGDDIGWRSLNPLTYIVGRELAGYVR